jgi:hypothetical protein
MIAIFDRKTLANRRPHEHCARWDRMTGHSDRGAIGHGVSNPVTSERLLSRIIGNGVRRSEAICGSSRSGYTLLYCAITYLSSSK